MAKFNGYIGYVQTVETAPDVWEEQVIEKHVTGDFVRKSVRLENTSQMNSDLNFSNEISVIARPYILSHLDYMRYVKWRGLKWSIQSFDVQYPRFFITLGGLIK